MDRSLDDQIAQLCSADRFDEAITVLLRELGSEILGFLRARLRDDARADEVFAVVAEKAWRGLPRFEGRSSLRVWVYAIAVNALRDDQSRVQRERRRLAPSAELSRVVEEIRSSTAPYRRTEVKDRLRALRDELDPEDQILLVLRVDKGLSYRDVATAMARQHLDASSLSREAARLRKRFQHVKDELRAAALREGLVDSAR